MKNVKKLFIMVFTIIITIGYMPVHATSVKTEGATSKKADNSSTSNIVVETGNNGDALSGYKVVQVSIDSNNQLDYKFTDTFEAFKASSTDYVDLKITDYVDAKKYANDSKELNKLLGEFTAYVKDSNNHVSEDITSTTFTDGKATFQNVGLGQYILVGKGNSNGALIYQTVTAEVVPTVNGGNYEIFDSYSVKMKTSSPSVSKSVTGTKLSG